MRLEDHPAVIAAAKALTKEGRNMELKLGTRVRITTGRYAGTHGVIIGGPHKSDVGPPTWDVRVDGANGTAWNFTEERLAVVGDDPLIHAAAMFTLAQRLDELLYTVWGDDQLRRVKADETAREQEVTYDVNQPISDEALVAELVRRGKKWARVWGDAHPEDDWDVPRSRQNRVDCIKAMVGTLLTDHEL